jgi:hypothetical protein
MMKNFGKWALGFMTIAAVAMTVSILVDNLFTNISQLAGILVIWSIYFVLIAIGCAIRAMEDLEAQ